MNDLVRIAEKLTMSSREIAELTGKELSNIHRDIRAMLISLYGEEHVSRIIPEQYRNRHAEFIRENADVILSTIVGDDSKRNHQDGRGFSWERDSRGYISSFDLDKTHTMTLVSGYNVQLRKRIIDRWMALEARNVPDPMAALSDPATMRGLLLTYTEKVISLESKISEQAPKVAALERIAVHTEGSMCLTDAAKHLQVPPKKLFAYMSGNSWIYRRVGNANWIAYQDKLQRGWLEHKITTIERDDDSRKVCEQVRVTAKGLVYLSEKFSKGHI